MVIFSQSSHEITCQNAFNMQVKLINPHNVPFLSTTMSSTQSSEMVALLWKGCEAGMMLMTGEFNNDLVITTRKCLNLHSDPWKHDKHSRASHDGSYYVPLAGPFYVSPWCYVCRIAEWRLRRVRFYHWISRYMLTTQAELMRTTRTSTGSWSSTPVFQRSSGVLKNTQMLMTFRCNGMFFRIK